MRYIFIGIIKFYRATLSKILPPSCRFTPTCSQYAITAFTRFGVFKGGWLSLYRIIRCNPFSQGGLDEVPQEKLKQEKLKRTNFKTLSQKNN
ncbi:MAG: membrane protein insertion efficiency factor YidD [Oscillospiraceae bacterium]|nr:membrane protein insertion efficiency factor YidD [Oscillospiraceae bacterium]